MWYEISDQKSLDFFMNAMDYLHDSCIKEAKYVSGAYVNNQLAMHPINSERNLRVIIQRQHSVQSVIELEFVKLNYLRLFPTDENYTCEILDSTIIIKDNCIIWCDCGGLTEDQIHEYTGTVISASRLRWRSIDGHLGNDSYYRDDLREP